MLESNWASNFQKDVVVNVFEVTIRVLGGLLSAHFLAEEKLKECFILSPQSQATDLPHTESTVRTFGVCMCQAFIWH